MCLCCTKNAMGFERETTRVEDLAYCLMGIFGINMPMLYGEGERAFTRLQEEIIKVLDDYSLFAWQSFERYSCLLATSPAASLNSSEIILFNSSSSLSGAITANNKGIHLKLCIIYRTEFPDVGFAILPRAKEGEEVAIHVRAMSETKEYFLRIMSYRLNLLNLKGFSQSAYHERSICVRQHRLTCENQSWLLRAAETVRRRW
jgi:hypothetical protein